MTLQAALLSAIGALVSVVVFMAGVIRYLYNELRAESRARAKDSSLFLSTLEQLRSKYSVRVPAPERHTPSETPRPDPQTLEGFYSMHSTRKSPTRR
jgi:hypothetical protein